MSKKKKDEEIISVPEAQELASSKNIMGKLGGIVSTTTVINWVKQYKLGYQIGSIKWGKWYIYKNKFEEFINGKNKGNLGNSRSS